MKNAAVWVAIALSLCVARPSGANTYSPFLETRVDDDHSKVVLPSVRIAADTQHQSAISLAGDLLRPLSLRWSMSLEIGVRLSVNQDLQQVLAISETLGPVSRSLDLTGQVTFLRAPLDESEQAVLDARDRATAKAMELCEGGRSAEIDRSKCNFIRLHQRFYQRGEIPLTFFEILPKRNLLQEQLEPALFRRVRENDRQLNDLKRRAILQCDGYDEEKIRDYIRRSVIEAGKLCKKLPEYLDHGTECSQIEVLFNTPFAPDISLEHLTKVPDPTRCAPCDKIAGYQRINVLDRELAPYIGDEGRRKRIIEQMLETERLRVYRHREPQKGQDNVDEEVDKILNKYADVDGRAQCPEGRQMLAEYIENQKDRRDQRASIPRVQFSLGGLIGGSRSQFLRQIDATSLREETEVQLDVGAGGYVLATDPSLLGGRLGGSLEIPIALRYAPAPASQVAQGCTGVGSSDGQPYEVCRQIRLGPAQHQARLSGGLLLGLFDGQRARLRGSIGPLASYNFTSSEFTIGGRLGGGVSFFALPRYDSGSQFRGVLGLGVTVQVRGVRDDTGGYTYGTEAILDLELIGRRNVFGRALDWL